MKAIVRGASGGWCAEVIGTDARYGLARDFLTGKPDGDSIAFVLRSGNYYEVSDGKDRVFCSVSEDGSVVRVDRSRVVDAARSGIARRKLHLDEHIKGSAAWYDCGENRQYVFREWPQKRGMGIDVLTAAQLRIARVFDDFPRVYVSCSLGKDSTVMLHLVMAEAIARGRKVGVLFVDLEGQYKLTIDHGLELLELYRDHIEPYWVALPIHLRNAVSQFEPHWVCWEPGREADWIRQPPPVAITDEDRFPFYRHAMEFEEFVPGFGHWYAGDRLCACFVGIRTDESLNRYRSIARRDKRMFEGLQWTTWLGGQLVNAYPIYDWRTEDIWRFHALTRLPYNRLYDRMYQAGLTIHQARICQPYGDDQRKGLDLFHVIEPETWGRVLARVNGANQGALYAQERGNILGVHKISLPKGHTWESFAMLILDTMPSRTAEHYKNKIAVFLRWWHDRGYADGIPDFADPKEEAAKKAPSWRRICKSLLRHDYWCKGLSFSQHKSPNYDKYMKMAKARRERWGLLI